MSDDLPTRRSALAAVDLDGRGVVLEFTIGHKLYRCPGCGSSIEVGAEHVLVKLAPPGERPYHQHWHRQCTAGLRRQLRRPRVVPPGTPARPPSE